MMLLLGASTAASAAQDETCHTKDPKVTVNAATGAITGKARFAKNDCVHLRISNKNPFRYSYTLSVDATPVAEPDISEFIKALTALTVPPAAPGTTPEAKPSDLDTAGTSAAHDAATLDSTTERSQRFERSFARKVAPCDMMAVLDWAPLKASDQQLEGSAQQIAAAFDDPQTKLAKVSTAYATQGRILFESNGPASVSAQDLNQAADNLETALDAYAPPTEATGVQLGALAKGAADQKAQLEAFRAQHAVCAASATDAWIAMYTRALFWERQFAPAYAAELKEHAAAKQRFDDIRADLRHARGRGYEQIRRIGPFDRPHDVKVKLERQGLKESDKELVAEFTLNFGGGPRFAVAMGPVWTELENVEFGRLKGVEDDEIVTRVGLKEFSQTRTTIMALLHTRLVDLWKGDVGVFASFGATTAGDVFVGPSAGFADNRVFVSAGLFGGKVEESAGGFAVGDVVPESFTDDIPVRKSWHWKLALALSVRFN